ncbi:hypothetical protein [Brevibacterium sp. SMBL_HHYL_HB1]|jgi:hypothetical protein|uniref:hypothetical protein n=1 Tax=Brevibacterium sp. SMBL_HHYL_HB1 TaxID=2777556 RepID=UPI001BA9749F|nr:hypothetical protein [Brevibacterium sp. SMBL_HHYL_HB1]QUL78986.1 hypothetical protein IG171_16785 [Brevibacterium sp. SMBL_HHYL_HB1]
MKKLLRDRQSLREAVIVAILVPVIHIGVNLLGWGNGMFSWWEVLLGAPVVGVFYWFFMSSFRQFRDEEITPG